MKTRNIQILMTLLAFMAAATIFSSCSKKEKMENFLLKTSWKIEEITGAPDAADDLKSFVGTKVYLEDNHKMVIDNSDSKENPFTFFCDWNLTPDGKIIFVSIQEITLRINIEKQAKKMKASIDLNEMGRGSEEKPEIVTFILKPIK